MCGITALLTNENINYILLESLKQLQNRGYDSAGIASFSEFKKFTIKKYASKINKSAIQILEEEIDNEDKEDKDNNENKDNNIYKIGIAHTRWATHGPKIDLNSHPHLSSDGKICLVHNGIIENYNEIKDELMNKGYQQVSQTDSEVISNLISLNYLECKDLELAIKLSCDKMEGTWGLAIICLDYPNKLYCTRHGSPLLVSYNDKFAMVTSEQSGFCGRVNNYLVLADRDICCISFNEEIQVNTSQNYKFKQIVTNKTSLSPEPYKHWTLKEIKEQTDSSLRALSLGGRLLSTNTVKLGGLDRCVDGLIDTENIVILACGTSYNAGLMGIHYFKDLCNFNTVQIFDGSEFTLNDIPKRGKTTFIMLSQSGETRDLIKCIKTIRTTQHLIIGIVNVVDSQLAREVDCGCYLNAGREVGVASTKSFTSQVILISMIAIWFSQKQSINSKKREMYIQDLRKLYLDIETLLKNTDEICQNICKNFNYENLFILGKGISEAVAREGSLKIKEISYIHSEAYSSGSLKHGPFALLSEKFPVIMLDIGENHRQKNENAIHEINSRHSPIYCISDTANIIKLDKLQYIMIPKNNIYGDLLGVIPLQYLAYYLSLSRGYNPDYPRNLAKVVTVE